MEGLRAARQRKAHLVIDLDAAMRLTIEAAREAGEIAMRHFGGDHARWEKGPGQIVTEADIEIDRHLNARLLGADLGEVAWLSEETEDDPRRTGVRHAWIVDPIDGTRAFAAGKPEFTISIGLVEDGRPLMGVVFDPVSGGLFEAVRGGGAFLSGTPIEVSSANALSEATIIVRGSENRKFRLDSIFPNVETRSIGSLALKLAMVADGRLDAYLSWRRTHDWDIAAAVLLIEEAGGRVSDARGEPILLNRADPRHSGIIAAPAALHPGLARRSIENLADSSGGG